LVATTHLEYERVAIGQPDHDLSALLERLVILDRLETFVAAEIALVVTQTLPAVVVRAGLVSIVVRRDPLPRRRRRRSGGWSRAADVLGRRASDRLDVAEVEETVRTEDLLDGADALAALETCLGRGPVVLRASLATSVVNLEPRWRSGRVRLDRAADEDAAVAEAGEERERSQLAIDAKRVQKDEVARTVR
jgi:hypothetical protein